MYIYRDSWKQKIMQRGLRLITLQGAIEKSPILQFE